MDYTHNLTLIRLKDTKDENGILTTIYTEKPFEFLRLYCFLQDNKMPLRIDQTKEDIGFISDIDVFFGGGDTMPCIDVWLDLW